MNEIYDPALAARNRQRVDDAARKARNAERRKVVDLLAMQASPVEAVRLGRDVEAAEWRDPDDLMVNRRTPKMVQGHKRVDSLMRLLAGGTLTKHHVAAGFRLRDDYEIAEGARPGSERSVIGGAGGPSGPADAQLAAVRRYRDASQAMGMQSTAIVEHVVVRNGSIAEWAKRMGRSEHREVGYLVSAMDRLAEHYGIGLDDLRRVYG